MVVAAAAIIKMYFQLTAAHQLATVCLLRLCTGLHWPLQPGHGKETDSQPHRNISVSVRVMKCPGFKEELAGNRGAFI